MKTVREIEARTHFKTSAPWQSALPRSLPTFRVGEAEKAPAQNKANFGMEAPAQNEPKLGGEASAQNEPKLGGEAPAQNEPNFEGWGARQRDPPSAIPFNLG